jgi:hypothetical protein
VRALKLSEQSLPANPWVHEQETAHLTSKIVQDSRVLPEGSEYMQVPRPLHTRPVKIGQ